MNSGTVLAGTDGFTSMMYGHADDARDRRDVADEIEIEFLVERRVDCVRRADQEQCIAVRGRAHDRLGGDIAASTRPVLDDERLAEPLRQPLTDQARDDVGRAARRQRRRSSAPAATDRFAPSRCATRPGARQRPRPDAKIYGGEVSSSPLRLAKVHSITSSARQVMAFMCARRPAGAL